MPALFVNRTTRQPASRHDATASRAPGIISSRRTSTARTWSTASVPSLSTKTIVMRRRPPFLERGDAEGGEQAASSLRPPRLRVERRRARSPEDLLLDLIAEEVVEHLV